MRKVHFYKARSRLGIINPPIRQKNLNIGVEKAPDYILTNKFLKNFEDASINEFNFTKPEKVDGKKYFETIKVNLEDFKNLINKTIQTNEAQIVIGGDNSVTFSSLLALSSRVDSTKIGYVQFDSHGEMNLFKSSPTGNFHGMYLRPFVDSFDIKEIKSLIGWNLKPQDALFIGNMDLDHEEKLFFKKNNFKNINRSNILSDSKRALYGMEALLLKHEYIHVNFDIDVFDKKESQATGIPTEDGIFWKELLPFLQILSKHKNISIDLCEVNPLKKSSEKTIKVAQNVLMTLLT